MPDPSQITASTGLRASRRSLRTNAAFASRRRLSRNRMTFTPRAAAQAWAMASQLLVRSEEHKYELQSLMRISYAAFCLKTQIHTKYEYYSLHQHKINKLHDTPQK